LHPGPDLELAAGDILIVMASLDTLEDLRHNSATQTSSLRDVRAP
jgi:hypothetical protein